MVKKTCFLTSLQNVSIRKNNLRILLPKLTMVFLLFFYWPYSGWTFSRPFRVGGVEKNLSLKSVTRSKNKWIRRIPLDLCCIGNQRILLYQKTQIYIAFWYIIHNFLNFSLVFDDCFNKNGYNFDDVSKNG